MKKVFLPVVSTHCQLWASLALSFLLIVGSVSSAEANSLARSVPTSSDLIDGVVILQNGERVEFTVFSGGMLKIRDRELEIYYGIVPSIPGAKEEPFSVVIFEIEEIAPGLEALSEVERLRAELNYDVVPPKAAGISSFQLTSVRPSVLSKAEFESLQAEKRSGESSEVANCCVTCGNTEACGCRVSMACGSCCSGICCPSGGF